MIPGESSSAVTVANKLTGEAKRKKTAGIRKMPAAGYGVPTRGF
jgi:hypothetical protein